MTTKSPDIVQIAIIRNAFGQYKLTTFTASEVVTNYWGGRWSILARLIFLLGKLKVAKQ